MKLIAPGYLALLCCAPALAQPANYTENQVICFGPGRPLEGEPCDVKPSCEGKLMTPRAYTYAELEAMRAAILRKNFEANPNKFLDMEVERTRAEEMLRTAIMANVDPKEIIGK